MTASREYSDYLHDILDNAHIAQQLIVDVDYERFVRNVEKIYAVLHALTVIGEAARQIPDSTRARYKQVPWREVIGMRDKLIHGYAGINLERVWDTVRDDLPPLITTVEQMLADLRDDASEQGK